MKPFAVYVALGDSLLSDDYPGPGLGAASLLLKNRDGRFPEFRGRDLRTCCPRIRPVLHTRTGWTSTDLMKVVSTLAPSHEPTLILLSIGGNDMLHWLVEGLDSDTELARLEDRLTQIVKRLEQLYPDLTLRLTNVYDPSDGSGRVASGRDVSQALPVLERLNRLLAKLAGSSLVDVHAHFLGHGQRHRDPGYTHYRAEDPSGWVMFDIEPNPRGASEVRRLVWSSLP